MAEETSAARLERFRQEREHQAVMDLMVGLDRLSSVVQKHPEFASMVASSLKRLTLYPQYWMVDGADEVEFVRSFWRAVRSESGIQTRKEYTDTDLYAWAELSPAVKLRTLTERSLVCEKVQVGTKKEMVEKPNPDYVPTDIPPTISVEEEVPVYEWQCAPVPELDETTGRETADA